VERHPHLKLTNRAAPRNTARITLCPITNCPSVYQPRRVAPLLLCRANYDPPLPHRL